MSNSKGSQFWNGLQKVKHCFSWGGIFRIGKGDKTRIWHDVWIRQVPLRLQFPTLFLASSFPDNSVDDNFVCDEGVWNLTFKRSFGEADMQSWESLMCLLQDRCLI